MITTFKSLKSAYQHQVSEQDERYWSRVDIRHRKYEICGKSIVTKAVRKSIIDRKKRVEQHKADKTVYLLSIDRYKHWQPVIKL